MSWKILITPIQDVEEEIMHMREKGQGIWYLNGAYKPCDELSIKLLFLPQSKFFRFHALKYSICIFKYCIKYKLSEMTCAYHTKGNCAIADELPPSNEFR